MLRHWHIRRVAALLAGALLVLGPSLAAPSTTAAAAGVGSAPSQGCAPANLLNSPMQPSELALIGRFVVCIGKQWPGAASTHGHFTSLGGLPGVVRVLNSVAADARSADTSRFITARLNSAPVTVDGHTYTLGTAGCFFYELWDTAPPGVPSLAVIKGSFDHAYALLVNAIGPQATFLPTTAVVERGSWFHDGSNDNVRLAIVFAGSAVRPNAHC